MKGLGTGIVWTNSTLGVTIAHAFVAGVDVIIFATTRRTVVLRIQKLTLQYGRKWKKTQTK